MPLRSALVCILLSLALALSATSLPPVPTASRQIKSFDADFEEKRIRLSIDLTPGAGKPLYQAYFQPLEGAIVIDLRDVDAADARLPHLGPDKLVQAWEIRRPTPLTVQWVIKLNYAVPTSRIRAQRDGEKIVVDIGRCFSEEFALPVTRNVHWRRHEVRATDDYYLINELEIRLGKGIDVRVVQAADVPTSVEDPVSLAGRKNALALINGGFFSYSGGALGLVIDEGRVIVPHVSRRPPRTAVGITRDGQVLMNRIEVRGSRPEPIDGKADWSRVVFGLGGGPRLIRDGKVALTTDEEELGARGNNITRKAGRTAVARLANGHLLFLTVSGYRDNHGQGWQLPELAQWLLRRGAVDAMCLDGGGSVAMVLGGALVSRPPGHNGGQRKIANGLMLTDTSAVTLPASVKVTAAHHRLKADGLTPTRVVAVVTNAAGKPVADGTPVYFSTTGGIISPRVRTIKGRAAATFIPLRAVGTANVFAYAGLASGQDSIVLAGGPPRRILARLEMAPAPVPAATSAATPGPQPTAVVTSPGRVARVEVMLVDAWCNPLPDQDVDVAPNDGETQRVRTGPDGFARFSLPLGDDTRSVRFTHGRLKPLEVPFH